VTVMLRSSKRLALRPRQLSTTPSSWDVSRPEPTRERSKSELSPFQLPDPPDSPSATVKPKDSKSSESPGLSPYNGEMLKQRIREWTEQTAIVLRGKADGFTATTRATFSQMGSELNRVTGYEEIEALKRGVVEQETHPWG